MIARLIKYPGVTTSMELPLEDVSYLLNQGETFDVEQSGIVLHLPNFDALQYVIHGMPDKANEVTVLYYVNLGDSTYSLVWNAYMDDSWVYHMRGLGGIPGSLQAR